MSVSEATQFLERPLLTSPGQPLRVAVYSRISQAIRSGSLSSGALLPRETELGTALGVSRTVVREAMLLLEEDGLVVTKRGIGRFVAETLPKDDTEGFTSLEALLAESGSLVETTLLEFTLQETTDFVSDHLGSSVGGTFWFRECVVSRDGQPLALVQEYVPDEQRLRGIHADAAAQLSAAAAESSTLLQALNRRLGNVLTAGVSWVAASAAGPTRAAHLATKAGDPLLVLTQTAHVGGVPVYISKCALPPAFGHLAVMPWQPA
ncbi:MAG: GntR family transcriptional regulator [Rhodoglobus sp.]